MPIDRQVKSRPQGAESRQTANISECRLRWLLVRDLNPQIRAERNLARSAWRFTKITKGGLKRFAQCVVMERPLMAKRSLARIVNWLARQVAELPQKPSLFPGAIATP